MPVPDGPPWGDPEQWQFIDPKTGLPGRYTLEDPPSRVKQKSHGLIEKADDAQLHTPQEGDGTDVKQASVSKKQARKSKKVKFPYATYASDDVKYNSYGFANLWGERDDAQVSQAAEADTYIKRSDSYKRALTGQAGAGKRSDSYKRAITDQENTLKRSDDDKRKLADIENSKNLKQKKMPLWMKVVVGILLTIITAIIIYAFYTLIKLLIGITTKDDISTTNKISRWLPIWNEEGNYPNYCVTPKANVDIILHCHGMNMLPVFKEQVDSMRDAYMTRNDWPTIEDATFNSLPNLITLNLSNSNITHIEDGAFQNLAKLEHLYLAGNRITALKSTIFNQLSSLIELDLRGNPAEICKSATHFPKSIKVHLPESCTNVPSFTTPGPDICNGVSCSDHGICETVDDMPICYCDTGYTGAFCEEEVDPCMSQPCKNGFACTSTDGSYSCICDNDDCKPHHRTPPKKLIRIIFALVVAALVIFILAYTIGKYIEAKKIGTSHL